ncbi:hypothetical protein LEP48_00275 [Isoptericola sp. NEAU-Y5]|uniref:Uncharacterized protein n=1 Tax=Isoptericola luteus TaxID=2879484 RepID=A0ABS7ZBW6_9MICO|nr:hypothetical protein [Isoptericola sp. NEAU-Y5]MCA5891786.1 hypothetical protein [Isoptericola sp. NEAU-Y5]
MKSPMMIELEALDPARELRAPGAADDDVLQQILDAPRTGGAPVRRPARTAVLTGAAAVAAVAVAVAVVTSPEAPAAYASWTPVPAVVPADAVTDRVASCDTEAHVVDDAAAEPRVVDVAMTPVLTEARGAYTYVVLAGDGVFGDCFVTTAAQGQDAVGSSTQPGTPITEPGAREVTVLQAGTTSWSEGSTGDGAVTSAFGRAGTDVSAVELTLATGDTVEATVQDGWWAVWAPGPSSIETDATVTFADGTTSAVRVAPGR